MLVGRLLHPRVNGTWQRPVRRDVRSALRALSSTTPWAPPAALSSLHVDAHLAELASLCYTASDGELESRLQAAGLRLVRTGTTHFTRFFVADSEAPPAGGEPHRYVCIRGVSWAAPASEPVRVWRSLANFWPTPFLPHLTERGSELVAHAGVSEMAAALWAEVRNPVESARGQVTFAGHSLGGSLAALLTGLASLQLGIQGDRLTCVSFGSPPVAALKHGGNGGDLPRALRVPPSNLRSYVLDQDPVPRTLLAADPALAALKELPAVRALMGLRERLVGDGPVLSKSRFLYHAAGTVFLVRWEQERGYTVRQLHPADVAKELAMDVEGMRAAPLRVAHAVLDHHSGSYAQALRSAAASMGQQRAFVT